MYICLTLKTKIMKWKEIKYRGVLLIIEFTVDGKHYEATRENPAEYPELIMQKITALDSELDLTDLFTEKQLDEIYEELTNN